jgi:hypothetical protein
VIIENNYEYRYLKAIFMIKKRLNLFAQLIDKSFMRILIVMLMLFTSSCLYAQSCKGMGIHLYGTVHSSIKVNGNIQDKIEKSEFPQVWNANSDQFKTLYVSGSKALDYVNLKVVKEEEVFYSQQFKLQENHELIGSNFMQKIFPGFRKLPVTLHMELIRNDELLCKESFELESIQ